MMDTPALAAAPVRKRRRLLGSVLVLFGIVVTAVGIAPSLFEWSPELRNRAAQALFGEANGKIEVDSLSAGWFEPIIIRGVRIVHPSGESLIDVEQIESDRPLWHLVWTPSDMGTVRIERPVVNLALRADGNNFHDVFGPLLVEPKPPTGLKFGVGARVVDGTFRCRSNEYAEPWEITGINLGVGLRPASRSESGKPEFIVERGLLLDRAKLSAGLCNDLLSYVAPVLARVAYAEGSVTIALDDWRLPFNDMASGELSGRITMHTVDAAPGPLVKQLFDGVVNLPVVSRLTSGWRLPTGVQLARESVIPFEMVDGRIHHDGLRFSLVELVDVRTDGYVGLDETLDLTATLGFHPPNAAERRLAVLRLLTEQPWPIKIGGMLGAPVPDFSPLSQSAFDLASRVLADQQAGNPSLGGDAFRAINELGIPIEPVHVQLLLNMLRPKPQEALPPQTNTPPNVTIPPESTAGAEPRVPTTVPPDDSAQVPPPPAPPTSTSSAGPEPLIPPAAVEGIGLAVDVLQAIRERRAAQNSATNLPPDAPPPPDTAPAPAPRRPLLGRGLRLLLDATSEQPSAPPPPAPERPSPSATGK